MESKCTSIIDYAQRNFPSCDCSRTLDGKFINRIMVSCQTIKKVGDSLEKYGIKKGQNVGSVHLILTEIWSFTTAFQVWEL